MSTILLLNFFLQLKKYPLDCKVTSPEKNQYLHTENQFTWEQESDWHFINNGELQFKEVHFSKWKGHVLGSIQIKIEDDEVETFWSNELHVHAIRRGHKAEQELRRFRERLCSDANARRHYEGQSDVSATLQRSLAAIIP